MARDVSHVNVVDLEATCWRDGEQPDDQRQEIIEIGLAAVDTQELEIVESASYLIVPTHSQVSEFCEDLTTLTGQKLKSKGITFDEACQDLRSHFQTRERPWASWGDWDRRRFHDDCDMKHVDYPFGSTHLNVKTMFSMMRGLKNEKGLSVALDIEEMDFQGQPHRGIDDAYNIAHLLCRFLKSGWLPHEYE